MKKKSSFYKPAMYILISLVMLILDGCVSDVYKGNSSPSKTPHPPQIFEQTMTSTSTITPLPILTGTKSPTPTAEQLWTPLPTIHPDKVDGFIESMHGKCELPCWGNIIPEKTSEMEAKQIFSSFGTIIESTSIYFHYRQKPAVIDLAFENGVVYSINLPPELTGYYQLSDLLSRYGEPVDIRMEVIPETAKGTPWFYLAIFYPQKGILAVFSGEGKIVNSNVNVCFGKISPDLYLIGNNKYSLDHMDSILDTTLRNILKPLALLTEVNEKQFYATFSRPTNQCLVTTAPVP